MLACFGESLTKRLRSETFRSILHQDVAYFNEVKHSTGALCTRLATDTTAVQTASGVRFGLIIEYVVSVGIGIIIGFVFSWQLTLLVMAFLPILIGGGYFQIRLTAMFERKDKKVLEDAGKV
jgi:ABC-type bacteriocin/lantibiotic exporter with double-glycine peptidase domain